MHLAKLMYVEFIHFTQITLRPNIQLLSSCSMLISRFLVTSWFYSVCNFATRLVNFIVGNPNRKKMHIFGFVGIFEYIC